MNTKVWKIRAFVASRLIVIVAACCLVAGCDDGPTAPSVRAAPTPVPVPNVAGTWQGHSRTQGPAILCGSETPASATLAQDGTHVTGTVLVGINGVRGSRSYQGDLQGTVLTGTLTDGGTTTRVTGGASSTNITMRSSANGGGFFCGATTITLLR